MENERLIDIVRETFNLTKTEAKIVLFLYKKKDIFKVVDLVNHFEKDRTTIAKALIKIRKNAVSISLKRITKF